MRRVALTVLVLLAVAGCASEPTPDPPGPRVLVESQMRAFTDRALAVQRTSSDSIVRSLAEAPDATGGFYPSDGYRAQIEDWGRNVCSHIIAGVPPEDAFAAAYPRDPKTRSREYREIAQIAADVLCPTT
jgi:hypothetical protein